MNNQDKQQCQCKWDDQSSFDEIHQSTGFECGCVWVLGKQTKWCANCTQSDIGWDSSLRVAKEFNRRLKDEGSNLLNDHEVGHLAVLIAEQLKREREKMINEEVAVLNNLLLTGHGGGNWRRLITMLIERLEAKYLKEDKRS